MEVSLHSTFRLTCRGQTELSWNSPVYLHDQIDTAKKGLFISTVTVGNATAAHTGEYICYYDSSNNTEETSIYIYVPGTVGTHLSFCTSRIDTVTLFKRIVCYVVSMKPFVHGKLILNFFPTTHADPETPFVPSMSPFENHVLTSHDEMEIPCRVTDPSTTVSLIHIETNQVLPSIYDSKRGFIGLFSAGTYVCRTLTNGQTQDSIEYIVHGWTGENEFDCVNGR